MIGTRMFNGFMVDVEVMLGYFCGAGGWERKKERVIRLTFHGTDADVLALWAHVESAFDRGLLIE